MALERNGASVARLFSAWGLADVAFLDEIPTLKGAELAALLEGEIGRLQLEVVIVDHLQNLTQVPDGNDYASVSNALEPLLRVAKKTGAHLVLLHHQGKDAAREEIDAMGSEAYRAAADVLIEASKSGESHFVRAIIRGEADLPKTRIIVNLQTGEVDAVEARAAEIATAINAIVAILRNSEWLMTEGAIRDATGLNRTIVSGALREALTKGELVRTGAGVRGNRYLYGKCSPESSQGKAGKEFPERTYGAESRILSQYSVGKAGKESNLDSSPARDAKRNAFLACSEKNPAEHAGDIGDNEFPNLAGGFDELNRFDGEHENSPEERPEEF